MSKLLGRNMGQSIVVGMLMGLATVAAWVMTPRQLMAQMTSLEKTVPARFGDWTQMPSGQQQMALSIAANGERSEEQPYDEVVMRTYANSRGERVMLALAYAREQRQEVKIHRPEVCYRAQGYQQLDEQAVNFAVPRTSGVEGLRLFMQNSGRIEAVSYWIRVGDAYPRGGLDTRLSILKDGLAGKVPDAILVRTSTILTQSSEANTAFQRQERFLAELVQAMRPQDARMLIAQESSALVSAP